MLLVTSIIREMRDVSLKMKILQCNTHQHVMCLYCVIIKQ
jgi:hypothetical protein